MKLLEIRMRREAEHGGIKSCQLFRQSIWPTWKIWPVVISHWISLEICHLFFMLNFSTFLDGDLLDFVKNVELYSVSWRLIWEIGFLLQKSLTRKLLMCKQTDPGFIPEYNQFRIYSGKFCTPNSFGIIYIIIYIIIYKSWQMFLISQTYSCETGGHWSLAQHPLSQET